ncbi:MAG: hypothetical protein ACMG6S_28815 [Byssovorax sp.]
MRRAVQTILFLLCLVFTVSAAVIVLGDNAEVEAMAKAAACAGEGATCRPQATRMERTPLAQSFDFVTGKRKVEVRCARSFVLVGEHSCAVR